MKYTINAMLVLVLAAAGAASGITAACGAVNNDDDSSGDSDSDSDSDTDSDSDSDGDVTIYDIQQGDVAEDAVVTLSGVVVTSPIYVDDSDGTFFVEEPEGGQFSGIAVYMWSEVLAEHSGLQPGDVLDLTGTYTEYYDLSEITVQSPLDIEVVGTADVPGPDIVSPDEVMTGGPLTEAYESVLIKVEDVTVTDSDAGFGEFVVDDSLHVDDYFFESGGGPSGPNITTANDDTFGGITGILLFSFDEFKLGPRFQEDYQDWVHEQITIYDIQEGLVPEDTVVTIENVVVSSPVHVEDQLVFVQETGGGQYSGILLYLYSEVLDANDLEPGDLVTFTGTYEEYYDMSEITVTDPFDFAEIGTVSPPVPEVVAPVDIATGGDLAEAYEGVLVQVQDVTVTNPDFGFGSFVVTDGLIVDDFFFASDGGPSGTMPAVALDDVFTTLSGPLAYDFDEFRVYPRDAADMDFQ